jgi:hypothetical protein
MACIAQLRQHGEGKVALCGGGGHRVGGQWKPPALPVDSAV